MSQVGVLYRLQQTDDEIRQDTRRLGAIARLLKGDEALARAQQELSQADAEVHRWRSSQTDLNLELRALNDKAQRSETRLYSGAISNPKELADLQHEVESLGRRRAHLEDELLEAMINAEEAQESVDAVTQKVAELEGRRAEQVQSLGAEQLSLARRLKELNSQRENLAVMATPQGLSHYESTLRRAGNPAVVGLRNGRCLGCQVRVPAQDVKAADEGKLVFCDNCSRILCPV
jgi:uncharacterized protein